jgi:hypothetical protein
MSAILELLKKVGRVADTADNSSWASKAWNIIVSLVALCALIVAAACKVGMTVPGIPCSEVGSIVTQVEQGEAPTLPAP